MSRKTKRLLAKKTHTVNINNNTKTVTMSTAYHEGGSLGGGGSYHGGGSVVPPGGDYVDLHELAKGWKAAIARAKDPATR
jgi:hypothetical protein